VTRPGLAKARKPPFVLSRATTLFRTPDCRWRELFDRADVVSEGSVRDEKAGRVWYGSTSLILSLDAPETPDESPGFLATLVARDAHVRLRALRMAHREASLRAPGRLGRVSCEMRVSSDSRGVRIDVDVQAPLIERRAHAKPAR
jgi:hypothetical protein